MDFHIARKKMVEQQLMARGIRDPKILGAMGRVPRHEFVDPGMASQAYLDHPLNIGCKQTISQPYIVALMTAALELKGTEKVLEIGTGSGYQTAILAELADSVFSIERHAELSRQAERRLKTLAYENVRLRTGDGSLGWPDEAPFDRIIVTAAVSQCPPALWEQLKEGGILVGPFGPSTEQALYETHKIAGQQQSRVLTGCRFVPLVSNDK